MLLQWVSNFLPPQCPVNCVTWSPLSPHAFLSCSSDWTIQLWTRDHFHPVLSFTSTQRAVYDIKWSPKWATVFGVVNEGQLEIWDLNSSMWVSLRGRCVWLFCLTLFVSLMWNTYTPLAFSLDPIIVQPAAPGVKMKSLLFASQTDCVLVGDSDGQVTVYQLKNLSVGESSQVKLRDGWSSL